jgi:hypothetical protein
MLVLVIIAAWLVFALGLTLGLALGFEGRVQP